METDAKPVSDGWDYGGGAAAGAMDEGGAAAGTRDALVHARACTPAHARAAADAPPPGLSLNGDGGASKSMGLFGMVTGCALHRSGPAAVRPRRARR